MSDNNKGLYSYLMCFFIAVISLLICSKCSPLYPLNDWVDINVFYTMGKGMLHGKTLYADLMDHKGPYVYALAGVASIIDKAGFFGYFLLEILNLYVFLIYVKKTVALYVKSEINWMLPILAAGITASRSFVHGGSLEELSLGIFAYSLYSILRLLHTQKDIKYGCLLANGVLAGVLFWSKFTMLGFYIAWIAILFFYFIFQKNYKKAFKSCAIFAGGVLIATIPWIIYFGVNNAIGTWLKIYIWDNIFGYAQQTDDSIFQKMINALCITIHEMKFRSNWGYSIFAIAGSICFLLAPKKKVKFVEKFAVLSMELFMAIGIYVGGNVQDYYNIPLAVFSILGVVVIIGGWNWLWDFLLRKKIRCFENKRILIEIGMCIITLTISNIGAFLLSSNTYLLCVEKKELPQYRFAEIIKESEDTSMLNYAFLDGGFYTVLQTVPQVRYFCTTNMNYLDILQIQNEYLEQQLTNWVVTWRPTVTTPEELSEIPVLTDYYQLVDYQYYFMEEDVRTYALYKKKDNV